MWSERVAYLDGGFLSVGLGTGPEHVDEVLARVEALTLDDVHDAARTVVAAPRTLSVVGSFDESDFDAGALGLG